MLLESRLGENDEQVWGRVDGWMGLRYGRQGWPLG